MAKTRDDAARYVANEIGLSTTTAKAAVGAMLDFIIETAARGEKVQLVGFGSFSTKTRAAHKGVNPQTKQVMEIAEMSTPHFKPGQAFRDAVR